MLIEDLEDRYIHMYIVETLPPKMSNLWHVLASRHLSVVRQLIRHELEIFSDDASISGRLTWEGLRYVPKYYSYWKHICSYKLFTRSMHLYQMYTNPSLFPWSSWAYGLEKGPYTTTLDPWENTDKLSPHPIFSPAYRWVRSSPFLLNMYIRSRTCTNFRESYVKEIILGC